MTVLIADKSVHIIDRLESLLLETNSTLHIYQAFTYSEIVKVLFENKPDVILLDLNVIASQLSCLIKEIKRTNAKTCIVILSISASKNLAEKCLLNGADFFLDKYYDFEKLPAIVNKICKSNN